MLALEGYYVIVFYTYLFNFLSTRVCVYPVLKAGDTSSENDDRRLILEEKELLIGSQRTAAKLSLSSLKDHG